MSMVIKTMLFPFWLIWAWIIGMVKMARNDLHPHPEMRAKFMVFFAVMFAQAAVVAPMLNDAGRTVVWSYLGGTVLVIGWGSYLVNHHWRHAFF